VLWDVAKREQFGTLRGHRDVVYDVAFSPDGEWIATGSLDYTVRIWEKRTGQNIATLSGLGPGRRVQWSPSGDYLATSSHSGRLVFLYLITGRNRVQQWLTGRRGEISCVAADPRRERFTTSGGLEFISWDLSVSRPIPLKIGPNPGGIICMAHSPDGSLVYLDHPRSLVTLISDAVLLFNFESGKLERKVELAGGPIWRLVADRERNRLVVGFHNGAIGSLLLPDLTPGPRLAHAHEGSVDCLALSPDGRLLATGGADRRVVLRDAMSFERLFDLPLWAGTLRNLSFDFSGRHLAIVGTDSDVDLWDLAALNDDLKAVGLAWDRPAPAVMTASGVSAGVEQVRPAVPIIRRPGASNLDRGFPRNPFAGL
jgi:WD40 repeat protein